MSKKYKYIRLENIDEYEGWDLVEIIPAKFERYYDMAVICSDDTPQKLEELTKQFNIQGQEYDRLYKESLQWKTEVERLQKLLDDKCDMCIVRERNKAVKDFADRLCQDKVSNDPVVIAVKCELEEMGCGE